MSRQTAARHAPWAILYLALAFAATEPGSPIARGIAIGFGAGVVVVYLVSVVVRHRQQLADARRKAAYHREHHIPEIHHVRAISDEYRWQGEQAR